MAEDGEHQPPTDTASRNTIGQRLEWAIQRQPREGRRRGIRLFQQRMEERAQELREEGGPELRGYGLASIHGYVRDEVEPPLMFLREAARILSVREAWLAFGEGAPTEEAEAARREGREGELQAISNTIYEALGVRTVIPEGTPTMRHPDGTPDEAPRFWGAAVWTPIVRQTALRLYQMRPAWDRLEGREPRPSTGPDADTSWWTANQDLADAIAAPLRPLELRGEGFDLEDIGDYVQAVSLALQRLLDRYSPTRRPFGMELGAAERDAQSALEHGEPTRALAVLRMIRDNELHRPTFEGFEEYIEVRWAGAPEILEAFEHSPHEEGDHGEEA